MRDPAIDSRLQRWAEAIKVGDGSGYARVNTIHPNWSPPTKGVRPTMKVSGGSDVRETHRAVGQLSLRLRNTVVVHYVMGLGLAEQAERLECAESTVGRRIEEAHAQLMGILSGTSIQLTATK